jgi:predicted ABC-type ATPase
VALWFLALPKVEASLARVAQRGHHILDEVVRCRFGAGNLEGIYKGLVDAWVLYDNSETVPVLVVGGKVVHVRLPSPVAGPAK